MLKAIIFGIFAISAIGSSILMITREKPVHSALAFLGSLVSLAGLFLLLIAQFVAVLQILVYAGAILVLFLFVIMLLHAYSGEGPRVKLPLQRPLAYLLSLALLAGLGYAIARTDLSDVAGVPSEMGTVEAIGTVVFAEYLLAFEIAAVLLLAGLLGAVVLTRQELSPLERSSSSADTGGTEAGKEGAE